MTKRVLLALSECVGFLHSAYNFFYLITILRESVRLRKSTIVAAVCETTERDDARSCSPRLPRGETSSQYAIGSLTRPITSAEVSVREIEIQIMHTIVARHRV